MGKIDSDIQATAADGPAPPPYTEAAQGSHEHAEAQTRASPTTTPYAPFPPIMSAHYQWKLTKTFHLGESADKRLYAASTHTGWGSTGQGIILYNGPTDKDPKLAAVGEESKGNQTSPNSVITLPPLPGSPEKRCTEIMRASADGDTVNLRFSIEVGHAKEELRREGFAWQTVSKGDEAKKLADAPFDVVFKLLRVSGQAGGGGGSGSKEAQEVLAVFGWNHGLSMTTPFRIQFIGDGRAAEMGERWAMMVIITGLRLWWLKSQHRISPKALASGEVGIVPGAVG